MDEVIATVTGQQYRAAFECMAKNDIRTYLNGVCLSISGEIVATNGHILYAAEYLGNPLMENIIFAPAKIGAAVHSVDFSEIILNEKKYLLMKASYLRLKNGKQRDNEFYVCSIVDGEYPDHTKIKLETGKRGSVSKIGINITYLSLLPKIFKAASYNYVVLSMTDKDSPIVVTSDRNPDYGTLIIMPIRIGD